MKDPRELENCPFCGAPATLSKKGDLFSVNCRHGNDCLLFPVKIPPTFGWEAIARKWNTRAGKPKKHYIE